MELLFCSAYAGEGQATLRWATAWETESLGFNVYRSAAGEVGRVRVNATLVEGFGTGPGGEYELVEDLPPGDYQYWLEGVDWTFGRRVVGPLFVSVLAPERELLATFAVSDGAEAEDNVLVIRGSVLAASGVLDLAPDEVQVLIDGTEVPVTTTGLSGAVDTDDFVAAYCRRGAREQLTVDVLRADAPLRMASAYVAPVFDVGDVWFGAADPRGALVFEARPEYTHCLLTGFRDSAALIFDVTDAENPIALVGAAPLHVESGESGFYLSYTPAESARCLAVGAGAAIYVGEGTP